MNNKKKMVLGAAFVVAIMALAGIGYAATNYAGTTTSGTNSVDVDYVKVVLDKPSYTGGTVVNMTYNTESGLFGGDTVKTMFQCIGCSGSVSHIVTMNIPAESTDTDTFTLSVTADVSALTSASYALYYKLDDAPTTGTDGTKFTTGSNLGITLSAADLKAGVVKTIYWFVVDETTNIYTAFVDRDDPAATLTIPAITYEITGTSA